MHPQVVPLAEILKLNQHLFVAALDGIRSADAGRRTATGGNSLLWVAGHVVNSRGVLAKTVGAEVEPYRPELFARGARPPAPEACPDLPSILEAWGDVTGVLKLRLEALGDADLCQKALFDPPVTDKSVLGAIAFLTMHESYHVGQLGYIRRLLGCETLAG